MALPRPQMTTLEACRILAGEATMHKKSSASSGFSCVARSSRSMGFMVTTWQPGTQSNDGKARLRSTFQQESRSSLKTSPPSRCDAWRNPKRFAFHSPGIQMNTAWSVVELSTELHNFAHCVCISVLVWCLALLLYQEDDLETGHGTITQRCFRGILGL